MTRAEVPAWAAADPADEVFGVRPLGDDLYFADRWIDPRRPETGKTQGRLFGGEVAARCLAAAQHTVPTGQAVHSLHGFFLREGTIDLPVRMRVDRPREGRSFSTRTVVAEQAGNTIFTLTASFHRAEEGPDDGEPFPAGIEAPETAVHRPTPFDGYPPRRGFEIVDLLPFTRQPGWVQRRTWVRSRTVLPDAATAHTRVLTHVSDLTTAYAAVLRADLDPSPDITMVASLEHTVFFHRPFRADDWLLIQLGSPSTHGSRGLVSGTVHSRDGRHVASVVQEALLRRRRA
ncbi:acyl-CoA thioesterase domain-containing protein [Pseudonocardia sp. NPDC049154]|uniref:acyl-CoA thioesterase n=1 Tax=Pseudonocardia sp. NPDC049154 TaxID=3155501 RepID=UPI0034028DD8